MMRVQNKKTFKPILLSSGMVLCLFLTGCRDKSVDHYNQGLGYYYQGDHDRAISDFNKSIKINPNNARAYSDRGIAYYHKEEYDKAWEDVHKAQSLGMQVPPEFLKDLREASERER